MNEVIKTHNLKLLKELYGMITPEKRILFDKIAPLKTNYFTFVLENIYQQHNASAIIRTCESLGVQKIHIVEKNKQYNVQRDIARGAARWIDIHNHNGNEHIESCLRNLKNKGYKIVATLPQDNSYTPATIPLDQKIAIVLGNEGDGVSSKVKQHADYYLHIPMFGFTQSFNVSVAAAICMYEIRQRIENSKINWKLSEQELIALKIEWCKRIVPHGEKVFDEICKRLNK